MLSARRKRLCVQACGFLGLLARVDSNWPLLLTIGAPGRPPIGHVRLERKCDECSESDELLLYRSRGLLKLRLPTDCVSILSDTRRIEPRPFHDGRRRNLGATPNLLWLSWSARSLPLLGPLQHVLAHAGSAQIRVLEK